MLKENLFRRTHVGNSRFVSVEVFVDEINQTEEDIHVGLILHPSTYADEGISKYPNDNFLLESNVIPASQETSTSTVTHSTVIPT